MCTKYNFQRLGYRKYVSYRNKSFSDFEGSVWKSILVLTLYNNMMMLNNKLFTSVNTILCFNLTYTQPHLHSQLLLFSEAKIKI